MNLYAPLPSIDASTSPLDRYHACKAMARGYAESWKQESLRVEHARAFCAEILNAYWVEITTQNKTTMKMWPLQQRSFSLAEDVFEVAENTGRLIAAFPAEDAGYLIGSIYTVMLPGTVRSRLGAYYTPPPLVSRLLDLAEAAGFDFTYGSAIDPACGGGAFLAPLALRMVSKSGSAAPSWIVRSLSKRLKGIELDPFAAWMTRVLLDAALMPLYKQAKKRLENVVVVADSLTYEHAESYDLVIGNPPYGRITLEPQMRAQYARSLYGHANLYGLFTDAALKITRFGGVIAFLTPTSFLGGQYFKALRELILQETTPRAFDFIADREGVFDDVLQETMLATYVKVKDKRAASISLIVPQGLNEARVERVGKVSVLFSPDPWILPRNSCDIALTKSMQSMPTRLRDLGYTVSTGQLVWNRHKGQLRNEEGVGSYPLIWAESVTPEGFAFSANKRQHAPFFFVKKGQGHLVISQSCILLQRTTSKEQERRLLAAVIPQSFLDEYGGAVIENHLNMVFCSVPLLNSVSVETICALFNSKIVDRCFRCISGSVAVSAYELLSLPLPSLEDLQAIEKLIRNGAPQYQIDSAISACYGVHQSVVATSPPA